MATKIFACLRAALSTAALCLLTLTAHAQVDELSRYNFTKLVTIEEKDVRGKTVKVKMFAYECFVRDDGTTATLQPIVSAVRLKHTRVRGLERIITAPPETRMFTVPLPDQSEDETLLTGTTVFDGEGRPVVQSVGAVLRDKNGNVRPVLITVRFQNWRRRKVEVRVIEEGEP